MFHLDNGSGIDVVPVIKQTISRTQKWFTEGDSQTPPSYPGADWFNIVQAELLNVLNDGGITPDKTQLNQLSKAIKSIIEKNPRFVKKSGDMMTGPLSVGDKLYILNNAGNGLILHAQDKTNNLLFVFVNDGKSDYKMAYNQERNSIEFRALDDVKINSKSVLKTGDAVNFGGNLLNKNLNELTGLSAGIYFQNSNSLATTQNGYPVKEAGDLQVIQNGAEGKEGCSQIYTTYRNVRQFIRNYRPSLKTWEAWVEQITTANSNQILPVGIPQPWPQSTPPVGWFECNGSVFNKNQFPKLAITYPSGYLPDLRGEFIRGWDNGRGIDSGREVLSSQGDAIRNIHGEISPISESFASEPVATGVFKYIEKSCGHTPGVIDWGPGGGVLFDTSNIVPTANENRVRNIAFMYIVKAE